MQEQALFIAALEREDLRERAAFLDRACAGDEVLRQRIQRLLARHEQEGSFLDPGSEDLLPGLPTEEQVGSSIGPYRLMEEIGEGGMGLVFVAEQQQPVRRKVALKVIKPGMDSRQVIARFEQERQALAMMDHPNIAKVLDGGTTSSGRPYFVMELVKGMPITEFCDETQLTLPERLGLFANVCQAVQHAHQKGVIHRDIKPSNVLVSSHDGTPVVKVIDFGIAKAIGQQLTDKTIYTQLSQMVGTPLYASPEQAGQSGLDVDTRTDIYALGVLLYELLTGTTPIDQEQMGQVSYDELRRVIREVEPPRPSARVSTLGPAAATVSANRKSEPRKLRQSLRGELDWVVMKCLEKDRNRRYETANELARDVGRYLADEPVAAGPPSVWYRLRKFVQRNRGAVLAIGATLVALLAGVVVSSLMAVWAMQAKQEALDSAIAEREAKEAEAAQRRQAEAVAGLLQSTFEGLDPSAPPEDLRRQLLAKLGRAAVDLDRGHAGEPLVKARLQVALGTTLVALGESAKGLPLIEEALNALVAHHGPDHPDTLTCQHYLGLCLLNTGQAEKAIPVLEPALERRQAVLGADHKDTLETLRVFAATLGRVRDGRALEMTERAWERVRAVLGDNHPDAQIAKVNYGCELLHRGSVGRGTELVEEGLTWQKANLGPSHPETLNTAKALSFVYGMFREYDKALALNELMADGFEARYGPNHYLTLAALERVRHLYQTCGRPKDEDRVIGIMLTRWRRVEGSSAREIAAVLYNLGQRLIGRRQHVEAEELLREARAIHERIAPDGWEAFHVRALQGAALAGQGRFSEAEPLLLAGYEGLLKRQKEIPRAFRFRVAEAAAWLVKLYQEWGKPELAKKWRAEVDARK